MDAGKLHDVIADVLDEFEALGIPARLDALLAALTATINQPGPAELVETFHTLRHELETTLRSAPSNQLVPSRLRILHAIGGADKTGDGLLRRVEDALQDNKLTPAGALDALQAIRIEVQDWHTLLKSTALNLQQLNVPRDQLAPHQAEIGVLLPEGAAKDLGEFAEELARLNKHLRTMAEVVGSAEREPKIRALAKDSFDIFFASDAATAALVVAAMERAVAFYKQILEVRKLRGELAQRGVKKERIKDIESDEREMVEAGMTKIARDLFDEFVKEKDGPRKNELRGMLEKAVRYIADRIERGVDIEARVGEEPAAEEEGEVATPEKVDKARRLIADKGAIVRQLPDGREPILLLDVVAEPGEDDDGKGEKKKTKK